MTLPYDPPLLSWPVVLGGFGVLAYLLAWLTERVLRRGRRR